MKKLLTVLGIGLALTLAGCSDDDGGKTGDTGVTLPDTGTTQQDTGTTQYDTGTTQFDTGTTTSTNSGQTCSQTSPCPTGEQCTTIQGIPQWPSDKGICVGTCPSQGATCTVPDVAKNYAQCALTSDQITWYCLYICEIQGKTYECPDPATQDCVVDTQNQGVKLCIPKGGTTTADAGI